MKQASFRPEIEGLRALAVISVVGFHLGLSTFASGHLGVDVFFVVSGYLICRILFNEWNETGHVDLLKFWSRRFRRLAPMAFLVAIVTVSFAIVLLPEFKSTRVLSDSIFALIYATNWFEWWRGTDYFNENEIGYFKHFWSLAVEEQFYLGTTFVVILATGLNYFNRVRFLALPWERLQIRQIHLIFVVAIISLGASIWQLTSNELLAFYGTHARAWQFCVGGLCAIINTRKSHENSTSHYLLSSLAIVTLIVAFILPRNLLSQGNVASIIVSVATAVFIGTASHNQLERQTNFSKVVRIPIEIILLPIVRYIGRISYSVYLWHWPITIAFYDYFGVSNLTAALILLATFIASTLSYVFVENPIRHSTYLKSSARNTFFFILLISVTSVGAIFVTNNFYLSPKLKIHLANGETLRPATVKADKPKIYKTTPRCHLEQSETELPECYFGDLDSKKIIVLFGDSHAAHWFPALDKAAKHQGYKLLSRTKSACVPIDFRIYNYSFKREYTECALWRKLVLEEMSTLRPDLIVVSASSAHIPMEVKVKNRSTAKQKKLLANYVTKSMHILKQTSNSIVLLTDSPWFKFDPLECLQSFDDQAPCRRPVEQAVVDPFPWLAIENTKSDSFSVINMNDVLCPDGICTIATNDYIKYHDRHHLTAAYSASLAEVLWERIEQTLKH